MSRCRCDPAVVAGCQCSFIDSTTIDFSGAGSSGDPFTGDVIFDPTSRNRAGDSGAGVLVDRGSRVRGYNDTDQTRADDDPVHFNQNLDGDAALHSTSSVGDVWKRFLADRDGYWQFRAKIQIESDASLTSLGLKVVSSSAALLPGGDFNTPSPASTVDQILFATWFGPMVANDFIELWVSFSGSPNVNVMNTSNRLPYFEWFWVMP